MSSTSVVMCCQSLECSSMRNWTSSNVALNIHSQLSSCVGSRKNACETRKKKDVYPRVPAEVGDSLTLNVAWLRLPGSAAITAPFARYMHRACRTTAPSDHSSVSTQRL